MAGFSLTNNPLVTYIKESKSELQKVVWPSRKTILQHTLIVVAVSLLVGAFFGALDFGLQYGFQALLDRFS